MLDALFINITNPSQNYQALSTNLSAIEPPIWASMLTQALENFGWNTDILDADAKELSPQLIAEKIIKDYKNTRLVVFVVYGQQPSASTQNMPAALETFKYVRELDPNQHIMFLGLHPSALPEQTFIDMVNIQPKNCFTNNIYVCRGEGILALNELLKTGSPYGIPGLYFNNTSDGRSFLPPPTPLDNLDKYLPGMPWHKLPMEKYRAHNWHCNFEPLENRKPYASLYTSLGCPYHCNFCCINAPFGKPSYRCWSSDHLIGEFDILAEKYNVKHIKFADELFVLKPSRTIELCNKMIERKYNFNIWAYARVDTCRPELLEKLKEAGVNWLCLGIESSNTEIRRGMSKGAFKETDIHSIVKRIKSFDISVLGNYIFGLPTDTEETMQQTLDLANELQCEYSNFYSAMAYPGSQLHKLKENKKYLPENNNVGWIGYSQLSRYCLPLPTEALSAKQVLTFRDSAFIKYYNNPHYLNMVRNKFGDVAITGIKQMLSVPIKRSILS